jgi:hypothetical protein
MRRALNRISAQLLGTPTLRVGFLENAQYPDGTKVALVAAIQEFGAPNARFPIPARPFFRTMVAQHQRDWLPGLAGILQHNGFKVMPALTGLGQVMEGQLRQSIVDLVDPPLSETTLMLRRMRMDDPNLKVNYTVVRMAQARVAARYPYFGVSTKPLIDVGPTAGHMLQSIDSEVTRT